MLSLDFFTPFSTVMDSIPVQLYAKINPFLRQKQSLLKSKTDSLLWLVRVYNPSALEAEARETPKV